MMERWWWFDENDNADIFIHRFGYFIGSESLNVASMYNNISSIFFISEEYDESELNSQNALTIYLANYGTSDSIDNLIICITSTVIFYHSSVSHQQSHSITHLHSTAPISSSSSFQVRIMTTLQTLIVTSLAYMKRRWGIMSRPHTSSLSSTSSSSTSLSSLS